MRSLSWLETLAWLATEPGTVAAARPDHPARGWQPMFRPMTPTEDPMARIPIEMPKLGYDMETGTIAAWVRKVGDTRRAR